MANMTLAIPEKLHKKMKKHSEIRWSEVARKAIAEKIETLQLAEELIKKSKFSENDSKKLSDKVKKKGTKEFLNADRS